MQQCGSAKAGHEPRGHNRNSPNPKQAPFACRPLTTWHWLAAVARVTGALPAAHVGGAHPAAAALNEAGALGRAQPRVVRAEPGGAALLSGLKGALGVRKALWGVQRRLLPSGQQCMSCHAAHQLPDMAAAETQFLPLSSVQDTQDVKHMTGLTISRCGRQAGSSSVTSPALARRQHQNLYMGCVS